MSRRCNDRASPGRRLFRLSAAALCLLCVGCASIPFLGASKKETLRQQVEADPFPNAQQAGL